MPLGQPKNCRALNMKCAAQMKPHLTIRYFKLDSGANLQLFMIDHREEFGWQGHLGCGLQFGKLAISIQVHLCNYLFPRNNVTIILLVIERFFYQVITQVIQIRMKWREILEITHLFSAFRTLELWVLFSSFCSHALLWSSCVRRILSSPSLTYD